MGGPASGLRQGLRTYAAFLDASDVDRRLIADVRPGVLVEEWQGAETAEFGAGPIPLFSKRLAIDLDGALLAVVGMTQGDDRRPLVRRESAGEAANLEGSFYFDPNAEALPVDVARWDQESPTWDQAGATWPAAENLLYAHLWGGVSPNEIAAVAELGLTFGTTGDVIPELGEAGRNGDFGDWPDPDLTPEPAEWFFAESGGVALTRAAGFEGTGYAAEMGGTDLAGGAFGTLRFNGFQTAGGYRYRVSGAYLVDGWSASIKVGDLADANSIDANGELAAGEVWLDLDPAGEEPRRFVLEFTGGAGFYLTLRGSGPTTGAGRVVFEDIRFQRVFRWVYVDPRLTGSPDSKQGSRDIYFGGKTTGGGAVEILNPDGILDGILASLDWAGRSVRVFEGGAFADGEVLERSEWRQVFAGTIDHSAADHERVTLDLIDDRERFNLRIPPRTYSSAEFPNLLPALEGKARPYLFGAAAGLPLKPIDYGSGGVYRVYELADCELAALESVAEVRSYQSAEEADTPGSTLYIALDEGTDYSLDLDLGRLEILRDVRILEVKETHRFIEWHSAIATPLLRVSPLAVGLHTPASLVVNLQAALVAGGDAATVAAYDETLQRFTLAHSGGTLLLDTDGAQKDASAWPLLGFTSAKATTALAGVAGSVTVGVHSYRVEFVHPWGVSGGYTHSDPITVTAGNQQVDITLPTPPEGATSWAIYRSKAGAQLIGPWYALATKTIDPTGHDVIYRDNIADAALVNLGAWTLYTAPATSFTTAEDKHLLRWDGNGFADAEGLYTGTPGAVIERGPDIVRFIVGALVNRADTIDRPSFDRARTLRPEALGLYLDGQVNVRDVFDRVEYSCAADVVIDADGRIYFSLGEVEREALLEVSDLDIIKAGLSVGSTPRDLYAAVEVRYARTPLDAWSIARVANSAATALRFGARETRQLDTYLLTAEAAFRRANFFALLASEARPVVRLKARSKLGLARIGRRVAVSSARGLGADGKTFRVLSLDRNLFEGSAVVSMVEDVQEG